ncbi:hypothetical protein GALMADRAFT_271918 [Galerina marginata CBS 339.88]|uniref:Uncharacterized protein n=1 Tax=Galerina marginata (strain CBS 339.88) TaxID=685588 RepID=A0A067SSU4_GALM3|nr:hypothetical protein GALMADRAFT_271918 [Galerina marginata CBS 339.88]
MSPIPSSSKSSDTNNTGYKNDCQSIDCERLHDYDPAECKLSGGLPCHACSRLAELDAEISTTHARLAALARQRLSLKIEVNDIHDPISNRLPPELISKIFCLYVLGNRKESCPPVASPGHRKLLPAPFLLASICRTWREIALSTPNMWTSINIYVGSAVDILPASRMVKAWTAHSAQLPLTLKVEFSENVDQSQTNREMASHLFTEVRKVSARWYHLILHIHSSYYASLTDDIEGTPLLEALQLDPVSDPDQVLQPFVLLNSPQLIHLDVSYHLLSQIAVRFDNLAYFKGHFFFEKEVLMILSSANRLVDCRISDLVSDPKREPFEGFLVHQSLKELVVGPEGDTFSPEKEILFDKISTPSLESLSLDFSLSGSYGLPTASLVSFFARSQCQLKHVGLLNYDHHLQGSNDVLIELLEGIPTLESVLITASMETSDLFSDALLQRLTLAGRIFSANDIHTFPLQPQLKVTFLEPDVFPSADRFQF